METLVDSLAWTLARVVVGLESQYVMGDVMRRVGNYTCRLVEIKSAEDEAEHREEGGPRTALTTPIPHHVADLAPLAGDAKQHR